MNILSRYKKQQKKTQELKILSIRWLDHSVRPHLIDIFFRAVSAARERHAKALQNYDGKEDVASNNEEDQYNYYAPVTSNPRNERKLTASATSTNLLGKEKEKPNVVTMTESYAKMQMYPILEELVEVEVDEDCEYC